MKKKVLFTLLICCFVQLAFSQDRFFYYLGNEKTYLTEIKEKVYIKFENKIDENQLNLLHLKNDDIVYFENENNFGAINPIARDVDFSYAIVSSDFPTNVKNDYYVMPFFRSEKGVEVGISHLFTVKLKSDKDFEKLDSIATKNKVKIVGSHTYRPLWHTLSCDVSSKGNALEMANAFFESGIFEHALPDIMEEFKFFDTPSDQRFPEQWNLLNTGQSGGTPDADINITGAWDVTKGSNSVVVAILDLGIQTNHPDLSNISSISYDADWGQSPAYCCLPHGMRTAGVIGADHNTIGIAGVSPDSPLMSITNSNVGAPSIRIKWADAIDFAALNGASIINCSWGFYENYPEIEEAIDSATSSGRNGKGCIIVAASGNNNNNSLPYPAAYSKTIAVGGTNRNDQRYSLANYGNGLDVVAPAADVVTLDYNSNPDNQIHNDTIVSGTSVAAPQVAGLASLILSVNNDLTYLEVIDIIRSTAQKVGGYNYVLGQGHDPNYSWNNEMGFGRIDACKAIYKTLESVVNISGPSYLCSTNTFTLQNAPAGSTVNWIAEPGNLFSDNPPSGSGTSATLSPYSSFASGQATITFTIENPCGVELEVQHSFWVGRPSAPGPIIGNTNPSTGSLATYLVASQPPGATSMNWVLPFCFGCSQPWSFWSGQNSTQMVSQVGDPSGYVQAMGSNPCGSGGASPLYVTPDGGGCGSCPIQIVHPNPASEELMLSFVDPEDGRTMTAEVEPYEVSLYDMHGARIFEGKSKEPVFRMDVSRLKNGFYYLHVLNRYGLTRKQIRVER